MYTNYIDATVDDINRLAEIITDILVPSVHYCSLEYIPDRITVTVVTDLEDLKYIIDFEKLKGIGFGFTNPIAQLSKWLASQFKWIIDSIRNIFTAIIQGFVSGIESFINLVKNSILSAIDALWDRISSMLNYVVSFFKKLPQYLSQLPSIILQGLSSFVKFVQSGINQILTILQNLPQLIYNSIRSFFGQIYNFFMNISRTIQQYFQEFVKYIENIPNIISQWINQLINYIENIPKYFAGLIKQLQSFFNNIGKFFSNISKQIWNAISRLPQYFAEITKFFSELGQQILHFLTPVIRFLQSLGDRIRQAFTTVAHAFQGFVNAIMHFPNWFPKWFDQYIAKPITDALNTLANAIWSALPDFIKRTINVIEKFFSDVYNFFTKDLPNFISKVVKPIEDFFSNPLQFLENYIVNPFIKGLSSFVQTIVNGLKNVINFLYNTFLDIGKAVWNFVVNVASTVEVFVKDIFNMFITQFKNVFSTLSNRFRQIITEVSSGKVQATGEFGLLYLFINDIVLGVLPLYMLPYGIKAIANLVERIRLRCTPFGMGMSITTNISRMLHEIADSVKDIWTEALKGLFMGIGFVVGEITYRAVDYYLRLMYRNLVPVELPSVHECLEMMRRVFPFLLEEYFINILRRAGIRLTQLPAGRQTIAYLINFLKMRGFADGILEMMVDEERKLTFTIYDRFGTPLVFDIALVYRLPTHSEICSFMMRDLFSSFVDFAKLMLAHGYEPSSAYMIWLLHFKYPTIREIWEFTCRAIAGECWISKDSFIYKSVIDDYTNLVNALRSMGINAQLFTPVDTSSLNMSQGSVPEIVLEAIPKYARWLAHAPFSWIQNYTSDVLLLMDIMAKVPTKTDLRWLTRYGIFEAWSAWGITFSDNLETIHNKLIVSGISRNPTTVYQHLINELSQSFVSFDLRQFCRMLMAEGHHPFWIPWIAIAESQIAFQSEKTLLRTGFLEIFREGLIDLNMLNQLLAGFFTVKYYVSYFDLKSNKWYDAEVDIPVMYLPVESKLLELRAVMDRANLLFRELLHTLGHAVRVAILEPSQAISELKYFVTGQGTSTFNIRITTSLSNWFANVTKLITGKSATLNLDLDYINMLMYLYNLQYYVEVFERVRYWFVRIIAVAIYRIMYGYVSPEDVSSIVDIAVKYAHLTKYEAEALKALLNQIAGIAKREYIPTPYELATLAEYVPEIEKLAKIVFEKRHVPKEFADIWLKLIKVRPLYDDIRHLLTIYERATRYGLFMLSDYVKQITQFKDYGFTNEEIQLRSSACLIDKALYVFEHIIPTFIGLTEYYRYVPESLEYLKNKLELVLRDDSILQILHGLDKRKLINFYLKLAINRSVYPYLRGVIYELIYLYSRGKIDERTLDRYLNELKVYGLNDDQIKLIKLRAKLRRLRYE